MRKKINNAVQKTKLIILKINHNTTITIKSSNALKIWLNKYPNAEIIKS